MTRLWLTLALLVWLPLAAAWAEPRDFGAPATAEIRELLQDVPAIRLHMVYAPGNGHQSANLRIVQRLRELGYEGRIQVVYENSVAEKLDYLVPGFDGKKGVQQVTTPQLGTVEFVARKDSEGPLAERMKITISGARDELTTPYFRNIMNTDYFVQLQPKRWTIRGGERAIFVDGQKDPHALSHLFNLGPLTVPLAEKSPAEQIARAAELPKKGKGVATLLAASEKVDWLPAYSIDFTKDPAQVMERVVSGLQKAAQDPKFDRPIVVPILSELEYFDTEDVKRTLTKLGARPISVTSESLAGRLAKAKPGEVVPVLVGRLPADVFDSVISRATLPVVLEGKNLTQQAMERGLPFLNVTGSLKDIEPELFAADADKKAASKIRSAFQSLDPTIYGNTPDRTANSLAAYFSEAKDGSVAEFFAKLKVNPASVEQDLTGRALLELKDVMAKTKPAASAAASAVRTVEPATCAQLYQNAALGKITNRDMLRRSSKRDRSRIF